MEFTTVYDAPAARFGVAGPLLVAVYKGATDLAVLEQLDRAQTELITKRGTISTLTIIGELGQMLKIDDGVRQRSVELGKKYEAHVRGSAIVVETRGVAAVMVRSFLTGFFLLSRSEMPMKSFKRIADGLGWLQQLPGQDAPMRELRAPDVEAWVHRP
ncbi:MAG: hypothetical protein U0228_10585 [Myxococcaceae bacterium]